MMRSFRSVQYSFSDCPFRMNLPKITAVEPYLNIDFSVSFAGKKVSKYIALGCKVTDNLGNCVFAEPDNKTIFIEGSKHTVVINDAKCKMFDVWKGYICKSRSKWFICKM